MNFNGLSPPVQGNCRTQRETERGGGRAEGAGGWRGGGKEREKKKTERFLQVADDTARDTAEW